MSEAVTERLQRAFAEASKLPQEEQELLAEWILSELASERRWTKAFQDSELLLGQLADKALEEHRDGRTRDLVADQLWGRARHRVSAML